MHKGIKANSMYLIQRLLHLHLTSRVSIWLPRESEAKVVLSKSKANKGEQTRLREHSFSEVGSRGYVVLGSRVEEKRSRKPETKSVCQLPSSLAKVRRRNKTVGFAISEGMCKLIFAWESQQWIKQRADTTTSSSPFSTSKNKLCRFCWTFPMWCLDTHENT